jgi:hypothetical protein
VTFDENDTLFPENMEIIPGDTDSKFLDGEGQTVGETGGNNNDRNNDKLINILRRSGL